MGRRGPAKKPAAIHKRQGTYREDRHGGGLIEGSVPAKPKQLSKAAGEEWDRLAPELAELGLLSGRFLMVFAGYCECVAEYWDHKATIAKRKRKSLIVTRHGNLIQHPSVGMAGKCLDRMVKLERELGLTPASATGLVPGSQKPNDDSLTILTKRRTAKSSKGTSPA